MTRASASKVRRKEAEAAEARRPPPALRVKADPETQWLSTRD